MPEDIKSLPKWAQKKIAELERKVEAAERTIPWTKPGMEWFTLFHPDHRRKGDETPRKLFTLSEDGAHCVCSLGPNDCVFVGRERGKETTKG